MPVMKAVGHLIAHGEDARRRGGLGGAGPFHGTRTAVACLAGLADILKLFVACHNESNTTSIAPARREPCGRVRALGVGGFAQNEKAAGQRPL